MSIKRGLYYNYYLRSIISQNYSKLINNTLFLDYGDYHEIVSPTPGIASLYLQNAHERDSGIYSCVATSSAGTSEMLFKISVERGDGGLGANG